MTFFTPGKAAPYLDPHARRPSPPPLSPLAMNSSYLHSSPRSQPQSPSSHYAAPSTGTGNYSYGHGRGGPVMGAAGGTLRRFPSNASKKNKGPPENQPSRLLSPQENLLVFQVLGAGRQTLSTAVVQLLYPHTEDNDWHLRDVGVLCFVRDSNRRSYFLEIVSLRQMRVTFSQEFYDEFVYRQPAPHLRFITFEGDEFMVGLSFASADEMRDFRNTLDTKMATRRKKQIERQSRLYDQATIYAAPNVNGNNGVRSPTITAANMHALVTGLGAPISPYATARPSPLTSPMSPSTKFNTVSGGVSPYVAAMGRGQGQGGANKSSFGTVRAQQSPYAMSMGMGSNGNGAGGGYSRAHTNVPMTPITIPKIHTSVVTAGPGGTEANQPIVSSITLSAPPKGKKNKTGAGRFGGTLGRRNSIASTLSLSDKSSNNKKVFEGKDRGDKGKGDKKGKKKDKKEKLTKADIGAPTNFVHVQHTGFDIKKGYTNEVRNEKYKALFDKIGISSTELQDQNTAAFIYQFIDDYEQKQAQTPPPPTTPAAKPHIQNHNQSQTPTHIQLQAQTWGDTGSYHNDTSHSYNRQPPPTQRQQPNHQQHQQIKRVAPVAAPQPPPVPLRAAEKRQAPVAPMAPASHQQQRYNAQAIQAQSATAVAPPPPPPFPGSGNGNGNWGPSPPGQGPLQSQAQSQESRRMPSPIPSRNGGGGGGSGGSPPPPPPPMPMPMPARDNDNGRQETEAGRQKATPAASKGPPEGRVNLLMEIQAGISLRKVEPGEGGGGGRAADASPESMDGLAIALHRALAERSKAIHSDSSSSEDEDGGDGEDSDESDEWK